ncbi:hypothetical protein [Glaciecola sp. 1036]|uniref:hypothetical protein n=1 Tax=Alteromonadaceae TaxID=72275 RepID=UPI003CFC9D95
MKKFNSALRQWIVLFSIGIYFVFSAQASANQYSQPLVRVGFAPSEQLYRTEGVLDGPLKGVHECLFEDINNIIFTDIDTPDRLVKLLSLGEVDIGVLLGQSEERDLSATFIGNYISTKVIKVSKLNNTEQYPTLGVRLGTKMTEVAENSKSKEVVYTKSFTQIEQMFLRDRIQSFIELAPLANPFIDKNPQVKVEVIDEITIGAYINNDFFKEHPAIKQNVVERFNLCAQRLPKSLKPKTLL